ncbi:MAG: NusG domain II-containing protein [Spirochaetia bacterium]|jgi:hypothetical protein|nr:NusG domain II-containing protein [Spirochaetia bacterium]
MKYFGLKFGDIIIFSICLAGLLVSVGLGRFGISSEDSNNKLMLKISGPEGEWIYPLDKELEIEIEGPIGTTHVHIESGHAWISNSPCKNKLCITAGEIDSFNAWVACVPNEIFIQIIGTEDKEKIDALSF